MAWYRCGMNATYNATTVSRSGAVCNYVSNVGGVPLSRFIANITPIQAGTGDPSPINPRAITGWSAVHAYRSGADTTNPDTYTINLGGTYYGGYLNVTTGVLTVTHVDVDLGSLNWSRSTSYNNPFFYASKSGLLINTECLCEIYEPIASTTSNRFGNNAENNQVAISSNSNQIFVRNDSYSDTTTFKNAMSGFKLVYELATPQTVQLTPAQLTQLLGENNVWADSGDSEVDFFKIIRT